MPKIIFTVTNDLTYDQRMHRIAGTLVGNGYDVVLVGRKIKGSVKLPRQAFVQKRMGCFFEKGFLFYIEYNVRLFLFLLFQHADIVCAIDLDTIFPVFFATAIKNQKRVYDAHELFTEQKEVITRPSIHSFWMGVEKFAVPRFSLGYTVNTFIANELMRRYQVTYAVIRNLPRKTSLPEQFIPKEKWILYQGSVNEGRCFETLIPAMKDVQSKLVICGKGNFFDQAVALVKEHKLESKIIFKGYLTPEELTRFTPTAYLGITLFESEGFNQFHSLANRFFDYPMAGIPQVCVNYPEYAAINQQYNIAHLIDDTKATTIAKALNNLLANDVLYSQLRLNCFAARNTLNWEHEQSTLLNFYKAL